ncbi:hypothetical protein DCAR_0933924 [Daucus carota subsp. sativus]|uniref:Replication protein A 70 kDa DNA-binding subunit B/D first OB fold domain-containing protein n=1 Tax=Daucus carota subsp. sativus TaxID=79200 RepID=A0A175YDX8_DAUCS|nr:hypothetical protein DCAR_0933924 [Daucus carota subsp. sativus]
MLSIWYDMIKPQLNYWQLAQKVKGDEDVGVKVCVRVQKSKLITRNAQRVAINLIFVDALGGRIHATIPAPYIGQLENYFTEGETYDVNNFVVRRYADMQHGRCFKNDIYIQLNHMTEVMVTGGVDYIQQHVFEFTDLDALYATAHEQKNLIDVVGILEQAGPLTHFRNRIGQEEPCVEFRITDMFTSARAFFYNEMAEEFHQAIQQANQHPIVVIISSCKPQMFSEEPNVTNFQATRFFINPNHEAVDDLRNALSVANAKQLTRL